MSATPNRKVETRASVPLAEVRMEESGKISGYALKFNVRSYPVYGFFREVIKPGAFTKSLRENPDVRLLGHHDTSKLLARTKSGTMTIREDSVGLFFEATLDETTVGNDVRRMVKRGDLDAMSFGFIPSDDYWTKDENGFALREIREGELLELSLATFPQYPKTEVNIRSMDDPGVASLRAWEEQQVQKALRDAGRRLRLAEAC